MLIRGFKNKLRNLLIVSASCITAIVAVTGTAHAAGTATMYAQAINQMVVGSTFTIQVRINTNGSHVNAVESDFTYDTSKLTFNSIDDAALSAFPISPSSTENSGTVTIARAVNPSDGPLGINGDFKVANITFTVTNPGTANITFQNSSEADNNGVDQIGTLTNASFSTMPGLADDQTLSAGNSVAASNNQYHEVMQSDGNLVVYNTSGQPLWNTHTSHNPGSKAVMQIDGNLVVYSASGRALWSSRTNGYPGSRGVMQSDGNFVIFNSSGRPIWSWMSGPIFQLLLPGYTLNPGDTMRATNGSYKAVMQTDGNFVIYTGGGGAVWSTRTSGKPGAKLVMQTDGNLVVYSSAGKALWASGTNKKPGAHAIMQTDGNLVVYNTSGTALWSRITGRRY